MLKGKILGTGERNLRGEYSLNDRVIGEVKEHYYSSQCSRLLEASLEVVGNVILNTHSSEHNCKVLTVFVGYLCLPYYLNRKLVVRKSRAREYRQLLTSDKGHKCVYRAYTCVYIVSRIGSHNGVERCSVYIGGLFGENISKAVYRSACAVEDTSEHFS